MKLKYLVITAIFTALLSCSTVLAEERLYGLLVSSGLMPNNIGYMESILNSNKLFETKNIYKFEYYCPEDNSAISLLKGTNKTQYNNAINSAFKGITSDDTALFYHCGHAQWTGTGLQLKGITRVYKYTDLAKKLASIPCRHMIVLIDSCYAARLINAVRELPTSSRKRFSIIASSSDSQVSHLWTDGTYAGVGFFTRALKESVIGMKADSDKDGLISVGEWRAMAMNLVTQYNNRRTQPLSTMTVQVYSPEKMDWWVYTSKKPTKIKVSPSSCTMKINDQKELKVTLKGSNISSKTKWESSNTSILTVSSKGVVKAKKAGTAKIYASYKGSTAICTIKVIPVKIKLNKSTLSLKVGSSATIKATVTGTSSSVNWTSSNTKVATVSKGKVTGKKAGTAVITASVAGKSAKCRVTVSKDKGNIKQVSVSGGHTAILKTDGTLWMCGSNVYGQLGDGTNKSKNTPVKIMSNVKSVKVGGQHTVILKKDGSVWTCGLNSSGQLGIGSTESRNKPVKIMTGVKEISAGGCTALLKTDGSLWICGSNWYGQLGDGTNKNQLTPIKIMSDVKSVSTAKGNFTAILKTDGSLWTCGWNADGQCGVGAASQSAIRQPVKIMSGVKSISAGTEHLAIIKTDNSLWMCGRNQCGQLGIGDFSVSNKPAPVKVMSNVKSVSAGYTHTLIIKTDGSLWACGDNFSGQLGTKESGYLANKSKPVKIMSGVKAVEAGIMGSLIIKTNGTLWVCGGNHFDPYGTIPPTEFKKVM